MAQEFSYEEVAKHSAKKDLYLVVHDKVYSVAGFVDEHPGGEEVLLDVGGQDATEAFEDVGHSDEAREILEGLLVGTLKRKEGDPAPKIPARTIASENTAQSTGSGLGFFIIMLLLGAALAAGAYAYLQLQEGKA